MNKKGFRNKIKKQTNKELLEDNKKLVSDLIKCTHMLDFFVNQNKEYKAKYGELEKDEEE